jgi:5-methylcytosine-specific restriction enzyme subunit McrC
LKYLSSHKDVDKELRKKMQGLVRALPDVSDTRFDRFALRGIQLHRNNRFYKFLLNVCGLVLEQALVTETEGANRFRDFVRDEHRMRRLFERFLKNFYKHHLPHCEVKAEKINWWVDDEIDQNVSLLPSMTTDISIRDGKKTLVIDAKFKQSVFQKHYDKSSFHSDNLYQLFSYLKNMESRSGVDASASGMLIYPLVNEAVHEDYRIHGHNMSIRTVDLTLEWSEIEESLLGYVQLFKSRALSVVV